MEGLVDGVLDGDLDGNFVREFKGFVGASEGLFDGDLDGRSWAEVATAAYATVALTGFGALRVAGTRGVGMGSVLILSGQFPLVSSTFDISQAFVVIHSIWSSTLE